MMNMINKIKNFFKENRGFTLSLLFIVLVLCYVAIPTLSEYNNENITYTITSWDGATAESYSGGTGTENDPYVISNGNELSYFALQLENDNYEGEYFILENDIVLNNGIFSYTTNDGIKYVKNDEENTLFNIFKHLNGFKGNFDGNFHTIYGLYIDESLDGQNGLFTNLEGNISNLYIKNSIIYGGNVVGGVVSKAINSSLTNVSYDGFVVSSGEIDSNAAGIISIAENTNLKNIINKASVNAVVDASGIVNEIVGKTTLKNIYNVGVIEGGVASAGLISSITSNAEDVTITNCYNDGILNSSNGSMIGNIENNTGSVTLVNTFNTQDNYVIDLVQSSDVYIDNSYTVYNKGVKTGEIQGEFKEITLDELKNKSFVLTELGFEEYSESENVLDNVWVWKYDNDTLPILYIDEINQPIANIYIKDYIWDDYKKEIDTLKFSSELVFNIGEVNPLNPIKDVYYYVSNEKEVFTKERLDAIVDWVKYEEIVRLTDEGFYVIYAKIVDDNDNVIYLNTDLLIIDMTGSEISITSSFNDVLWNEFNTEINNYYVNKNISISVQAEDFLSGISKIYYYLSDVVISMDDIKILEDWNEYVEPILITDTKTIVYVKVIDNCDYETYANSDLIVMNGYVLKSISPGMNGVENNNLYITGKSSVSLNFVYSDTNEYALGSEHQLVSNVLLPVNTKITLIDKIKNKVYVYTTINDDYGYNDCISDVCEAIYDFELFNEVGSNNKFDETVYSGEINEDFVVMVDFYDTVINENIDDVVLSLKIDNSNVNEIRNTLVDSDKKFSVISNDSNGIFTLSSMFDDTINYNENAQYVVDFSTKLNYKTLNGNKIFDTTYEDKNIGLSIKMVNKDGKVVERQYLKNIVFKLGNKKYSPDNNGIIKINLEKGISDITDSLVIQTYSDNYSLESGDYKFIISLYAAYDGMYSDEDLSSIEIPVYVGENIYNNDVSFNVIMNNEDKIIINKENEFNFDILVSDITENTNVRLSLYKKDSLSAYDQKYVILDVGDYIINNNFEESTLNVYYALREVNENNVLNINLNTGLLEKNGYMFVFELYEGDKLVSRNNKKFIIK